MGALHGVSEFARGLSFGSSAPSQQQQQVFLRVPISATAPYVRLVHLCEEEWGIPWTMMRAWGFQSKNSLVAAICGGGGVGDACLINHLLIACGAFLPLHIIHIGFAMFFVG